MDFGKVHGLSFEEKKVLGVVRPESVGQARRVEGVTPSGALALLAFVRRGGGAARGSGRVVKETVEGVDVEALA